MRFFASFESVIKEIFSLFQEPYDEIERIGGEEEFQKLNIYEVC